MIGRALRWMALALMVVLILGVGLTLFVHLQNAPRVFGQPGQLPVERETRVAIVLGAGLLADGAATPLLYDRVATAVELYQQGRVNRLLLSGDNRTLEHNEPLAMQAVAEGLGVPPSALSPDYAGRRTYDSCYRAREIFAVRRAIVVTQKFHIDRAVYLCSSLGIDSLGVTADRHAYGASTYAYWTLREYPSLAQAFLDVNIVHPEVVLGDPLPIQ
jgi:SanA protein